MSFMKTRKEKCQYFNDKLKEEQNKSILQIKSDITKTQTNTKVKINKKQKQKINHLKGNLRDYLSSYKRPNKVKFGTRKVREFDKKLSPSELNYNRNNRHKNNRKGNRTLKSILKHMKKTPKNKNKNNTIKRTLST